MKIKKAMITTDSKSLIEVWTNGFERAVNCKCKNCKDLRKELKKRFREKQD